jgi:peptide/nickel transport system ATP-binding protein
VGTVFTITAVVLALLAVALPITGVVLLLLPARRRKITTPAGRFRERVRWVLDDLENQLGEHDGATLVTEGLSATLTHGTRTARLTTAGEGEDGLLTLTPSEGDPVAFRWADDVAQWYDAEGRLLYDVVREVLDLGVLEPPRVLHVDDLRTWFHTEDAIVKAVDGLDVAIEPGRTLGLVGESGSGKSVTSLTIMGLLPEFTARIPTGHVAFLGRDLLSLRRTDLARLRGDDMAMIFQEPMTSLNPVYTVGDQVAEAIVLHTGCSRKEAMDRTIALFDEVGIPDPKTRVHSYPHEMSGGQKQRVMIAMALSCNPRLLVADEPTTALDVTIQKQILDLLRNLRDTRGMGILFITHDLGVIAEIADKVAVMYRGKLVEYGEVLQVFREPAHPYTRGLLACRPRLDSPYRLLPTVGDFLDTTVEDGEVVIREKALDPGFEERLRTGARPKMPEGEGEPVLSVKDLKVWFPLKKDFFGRPTRWVKAVDGISFDVWPGQTLGLVGESGCGKTTTGRAILRLVPIRDGTVVFDGQDLSVLEGNVGALRKVLYWAGAASMAVAAILVGLSAADPFGWVDSLGLWLWGGAAAPLPLGILLVAWGMSMNDPTAQDIRRRLQIIFQDPYSSLNPRMTIGDTIVEPMRVHGIGANDEERRKVAGDLLEEVGLDRTYLRRFPHEFSGGQRQRICIARTLALEPKLIICDESVSALDVSVQAQVLNLLKELQIRRGLTYIFISHDLSVVKFMSDTMCVMKDGEIVEAGPAESIYADPQQAYTQRLIAAIPSDDIAHIEALQAERRKAQRARLEAALSAGRAGAA